MHDAPPVPPAPPGATPAPMGAPAAPGLPGVPSTPPTPQEIPKPTDARENLSSPPVPGGNLEEIKNQVSAPGFAPAIVSTPLTSATPKEKEEEDDDYDDDDDALFDFSELDVKTPLEGEVPAPDEDEKVEEEEEKKEEKEEEKEEEEIDLSFIKHSHKQSQETYFVTTFQFKSLLEIVEAVKNKVKDASETHLRLLDIKAEEDTEFEKMRKDFQFIEDKLYEVDSIIFEK